MAREYPWRRPAGWWLRNRRYLGFQLRELGGVVSGVYGLLFLNLLRTLRAGESAYMAFVDAIRTPPILYVNLVLFALLVWHAVTWFMLIGKAQPIQFTERPLPWKAVFGVDVGLRGPGIGAALDIILNAVAIVGTLGGLYYAVRGWLFV